MARQKLGHQTRWLPVAAGMRIVAIACISFASFFAAVAPATASAPGGTTMIENNLDGFDTCSTPSASTMSTWWTSSPYYYVNIYMGGNNRASGCSYTNLTASWVSTIDNQGWSIVPTWVSWQAPQSCTTRSFNYYMSLDTATAYSQGDSAAGAAETAARNLGFGTGSIIYDDMEGYSGYTNSGCRAAVNSFVNGWSHRLIADGWKAGMYGSTIQSAPSDWATLANPPGQVWLAIYDSRNTAWGLSGIANSLFSYDQRTHQYVGPHNATYGGITLNIDTDCSIGRTATSIAGDEPDSPGIDESNSASEDPSC
jgi:hypothetical protein